MNKNIGLGFLAITVWCFFSAFAYVYTSAVEQQIPIAMMCFMVFGISTLLFVILNFKKIPILIFKFKKDYKIILALNLSTFGCWFFVLYPLKYIEPSVVNTIILCCIPIFTLSINKRLHSQIISDKKNTIIAILLAFGVTYFALLSFLTKPNQTNVSNLTLLLSVMFLLMAGFSLSINNLYTKKLSQDGYTPLDILTIRFMLLVIVTGSAALYWKENLFVRDFTTINQIIAVACVLVIIPQIAFQISIRELDPFTVSVFLPLMPVMTFIIESFDNRSHTTVWVLGGIMLVSIISLSGSLMRFRAEKMIRTIRTNRVHSRL